MKGELEGRELAPGAPGRVGVGLVPQHSREDASVRIETGVKGLNQDSGTRNFPMPAVVGGNQGNGTRGFTVAEITKVESAAPPLGSLEIPSVKDSAIGSYSVPSFRQDCQGRAMASLAEASMQGWSGNRATGAFPRFPGFMGEGQGHSGALDLTRVSHDITSGSLHVAGDKKDGQGGNVKMLSMAQQKGDTHSIAKVPLLQDGVTGSSSVMSTKRETPKSAPERNCMAPSKRLSQDGAGMKPLEAVIKRLKQDACAAVNTVSAVDTKRVTGNNSMASENLVAVKRNCQDDASRITGVTDVKRIRQDTPTDITNVTPLVREIQSSVKEAISNENFKNQSRDTPTGAIGGGATEMQGQKSFSSTAADKTINHMNLSQDRPTSGEGEEATEAKGQNRLSTPADDKRISHMNLSQDGPASAERGAAEGQKCVSAADIQKAAEGVGTGLAQMETTKVEKESSAMCSKEDSGVKDCSEGNTSNPSALPPALPVMQEKEINTLESFSAPPAETSRQAQSSESPPAPDKEKETPKTFDGSGAEETTSHNGGAVEACIKIETQDTPAGETSLAVKEEEQKEDIDKDKLVEPKQESEEKVERNQENSTVKDGEAKGKEGLASDGEGKGVVSDPSRPLAPKPEMVSTETQCDGGGIGPYPSGEDEYAFISDEGVPGECLGACEPGRKPYKCCQCDTSFRTPYELSRHSRVHSGERPFQCRLCHRCFKRKDHVEVHMRRHVEDRRHICGLCGVCFVTSSCLLRHQRRTHQAPGPKLPGEGEEGEVVEVDAGDPKGDGRDQPTSRDAQRNGRRNKKNKPDTTYRPGGKTVCIIKKRNLRQRSYSFVELEDDVECFESDEEDRIPFLKVQEQRREEEREEFGGQSGQLDHSLFPGSLFSSDGSLGHLLLLGEVSRLLSHSLIPGSLEVPDTQADNGPEAGQPWVLEPNENEADSDDSDCDPPLVACDVTFMEGEEEVTGLSQPDDNPPAEEAMPHTEEHKPKSLNGPCQATLKGELCQATPGAKEGQGGLHPLPPGEGRMARPQSCTGPPPSPASLGKTAVSTNKSPGTGVGAMGVPRTAWVVPTNNTKGKNTCDACRRRNEANRLAQMEKERQTQAAQEAQEDPKVVDIKAEEPEEPLKECPAKVETMKPPEAPPAIQPSAPLPPKPQKPRPTASKRGRKSSSAKKRRQNKTTAMAERAAAAAAAQRPHKCHLCPFAFRSATELKRHASTHSGERPFLCELCGAGFVRKCHLQLHVRRHSGERRHACPECRMRFFTPSDLARHQAIHQVGEKPLECHLCHLTFRRAFHLERHIRRHNDAAPFACKLCGAFFSSAAALRSHDKHHRTPGPHACPDCTAAFTTATALSRHRRVHSARHDRLLRAIERHATAKSSYECVSSEGSPLSLVIRKVAATTGASGEGGTAPAKDTTSDISEPAHGGEEGEERKADGSTPFANGEREESEKSASSQAITTAGSEEQSGGENMSFGSPSTNKENPSITEQMKRESKNLTSIPLGSTKSIDESQNLNSILPTLDKINKDCEKIAYTEKEESARVTSMTSVLGKGLRAKGETNSSRFTEETLAAEEDPYVFKLTAAESQAEIKSGKSNTKRNKKSNEESFKFSSTNRGKEAFSKSLSSVHTTERDMEHIEPSGSKAINRTREHLEGSGNLTPCDPSKREEKVSSVELEGQPGCGLPAMSQGGQEAERGGTCSLLAPTRKETDSLKEIHCRTTYHLSEDPRSILHSGSGCTGEQEGSRSGPQDGQAGSVREGVATTS